MLIKYLLIAFFICFKLTPVASAETPLKAAFIRDQQLWLKENDTEVQLTTNKFVSEPQWSSDGRFIAYLVKDQPEETPYLAIYDLEKKESYQPYPDIETTNFKWAPLSNQLAYTTDGVLNVTQTKNGRPEGFENLALGVNDFEWFPDGKDLIVSSTSQLLPTGWGPIHLFKVPVDANLSTERITLFYTVQANNSDFFAIVAENFKWSADGEWLSFIAAPTASLSNDRTTLCVISATGDHFQKVGNMLGNINWIKWAPNKNKLAFVAGEGRFFVENKRATVTDIPSRNTKEEYTPKGYVDLDIEWLSPDELIVARSKENKEWKEGPVPTMFTSLYVINIQSKEQTQMTYPQKSEFDRSPQVVGSNITWYREKEQENQGDVWVKKGINGHESRWIRNVDAPPTFFY